LWALQICEKTKSDSNAWSRCTADDLLSGHGFRKLLPEKKKQKLVIPIDASMPLQIPVPDARCSWEGIIHGYIRSGKLSDALHAFKRMQEDSSSSAQPAARTFAALLKACGKLKDADHGSALHAEIAASGLLGRNQALGNALVSMYAKCGHLEHARAVFAAMPCRNVVTWTALIQGHSSHGHGEEALALFDRMLRHGVSPNAMTFCSILGACAGIPAAAAAEKGSELHRQIHRLGLLRSNLFVGNALVSMYARCGMLRKAEEVFEDLPARDSITWNKLNSGYARSQRSSKEAMDRFECMQLEGIVPDHVTLCCIIKACANDQMLGKIGGIEDAIAGNELWKSNPFVGNALVDMYAKRGMLDKAREVFDELPCRDVVSWNALIAGYVDRGCGEEALLCFERMQLDHVAPDTITFSCILKACGSTRAMDKGRRIHGRIVAFGFLEEEHRDLIGSSLIDLYAKCELLGSAHRVFDALTARDVVTWTALIGGYAQRGEDEEALELFDRMEAESIAADSITLACVLRTCSRIGAANRGMRIHGVRIIGLLVVDSSLTNALLDMYARCGLLEDAEKAFEKASVRDVVSWTTLISGYAQAGELEQVLGLLETMRSHGHAPDPITFVAVLNACDHGGLVDAGNMFFEAMVMDRFIVPTIEHHTCLVDLLGRSGQLDKAVAALQEMPFYPSGVLWHAVLGACRKSGDVELARYVFEQALMLDETEIGAYVSMRNIYADAASMLDEEDTG
jgi:pentatricopeptide repeat protein